jgi:hypothetical protein
MTFPLSTLASNARAGRIGVCVVLMTVVAGACAPAAINLRDVQRIETDGRFVWGRPGLSPTVSRKPVFIDGERLKALVSTAQCRNGSVLWKGGIPATLTLKDGARVRVDGFSFYGRFLRIHRKQWCELADEAYLAIWQVP